MAQQARTHQLVPTKGLWTAAASDSIGPEYTPWCQNVRFRYAKILRSPGRSEVLDESVLPILDFAQHTSLDGSKTVIALSTSTLTDGQAAILDPNQNTFNFIGVLNLNARFDVRFSWTQGEEQLMIVRASEMTVINNQTASAGGGTFPPSGGGTFNVVGQQPTPAGYFVEYFKNHAFMANIIDGKGYAADPITGAPRNSIGPLSNRVQWSKEANFNVWQVGEDGQGNAQGGFVDLYDGTVEPITGMRLLNDRLVVYRNSSIVDFNATGDALNPFLPENRVFGIGCLLPWSLASLGQFHIFVGNDFNVYAWDGSNLDPIGSPIHTYVRQLIDPGRPFTEGSAYIPFAAQFMGYKEYWLVIPTNDGTHVLIYDYFRNAWAHDKFATLNALYEQVLPGAVGTRGFNGIGRPANLPLFLASSGTKFFQIDERVMGDWFTRPFDGGMDMFVDTPDMFYEQSSMLNGTLERVLISSDIPDDQPSFDLYVSVDRGNSFPYVTSVKPIDEHWGFEFADLNITANVRRYRFFFPKENGVAIPTLRAYTDVYVPSGEFFPTIRPLNPPDPNIPPANIN